LAMIVFSFLAQGVTSTMHILFGRNGHAFTVSAVVQGIALFVFSPSVRKYMRDLELIDEQISRFSIRSSACFCCTNQHVHPDTGLVMPCDRELVYASIQHWHVCEQGGGDEDEALDSFDKRIRQFLSGTYHPAPVGIAYSFTVALGVCHNGSVLAMIVMFKPDSHSSSIGDVIPKMMVEFLIFIWEVCILTPLRLATFCYLAKCFSKPRSSPLLNLVVNVELALLAQGVSVALGWLDDAVIDDFSENMGEVSILCGLILLLIFPLATAFSQRVNTWVLGKKDPESQECSSEMSMRGPVRTEDWITS